MNNNNNQNNNPNKKKNLRSWVVMLVICLGLTMLFTNVMNRYRDGQQEEISYSKFVQMLEQGKVEKVTLSEDRLLIEPKTQKNPL